MNRFNLSITILSLSTLLFACGSQEEKKDSSAYEDAETFVPNPQELEEQEVPKLAIGDKAPYFRLPNVDGKFVSIDDFEDADVLVINFTCNHCPTAQAYEERFIDVVDDYKSKKVAFVAISPNSPIGLLPEELGYTDLSDDFEAMQIRYEDMNYNFPYLYDGDIHEYSLAYGPTATPHVFVFDKERKLSYSGRLDASEKPGTANAEDLRNAIDKTLAGEALAEDKAITPAFGCSTKWAWKNEYTKKTNEEWMKKPVELEKISPEGLAELLKNETDELLLINFWATWCGPCIVEYPEFIEIQRMYGDRDFQFVSLSMDNPNQEEKVLKFLKSKYSAVPNYLIDTEDKYAVIDVVGKDWDGSLPITLLIEPGGNIAHKVMGEIKALELKRAIVDHPMIGRYY
ncbi:Alkyl hydroperoxide reductase and/or thiol-specific antioxidant family (AhpC/TSA) protein [Indibacter alkaliphilus LW1]|uniref:Alkyl hydroperoxide reductase and/or thiol-specific antioxidant family (AhpC/TSA) protein n=1 Tax=Indibacter alkaliphilus (strain CCUG 57479 / KCTC 22604 / LW1) TaxID=1189612 RepID=S2CZB4_INDAL|nr:redoxin domain-containing protein [Indibacter alkaliphilus]EOZ91959.1 Alkyl hydroperoxide reductase and/or thiol-specific antioxidant family (AhpC/TSA) protein [Indibacter alkaliphilus LW1]